MMPCSRPESPQTWARVGGALYTFIIIAAGFGEGYVRGRLIVPRDAAATAANIVASETLFRAGLVAEMLTCVCDVALALILFVLLRPAGRYLALLGAFFRLTFVGFYAVTKLFEVAALVALGRSGEPGALPPEHLQALASMALEVHGLGYGISFLFFGACCIVFGHLIARSPYLPRLVGIVLVAGGVGYVVFSVAQMLAPAFAGRVLFPWMLAPAFVGEVGLALWLLVKGIDLARWGPA